jgi:copper homeostasis protein
MACEQLVIPVISIIRPQGGDFLYDYNEFEMMKTSISQFKKMGCKGVALSILLRDNTVDINRTSRLVDLAYPMSITFVRGFDLTPDPFEALEDIKKTGCTRILTSGLKEKALEATDLLKQLVEAAGNEIIIMPASGINKDNLKHIIIETGAKEIHASARKIVNNQNNMIDKLGFGNYYDCDINEIKAMRKVASN